MKRYQLRLQKNQSFADFFQIMVEEAWKTAEPYLDEKTIQPEDFSDFVAETRIGLKPFVNAYNLCGSSAECSDEVEGAPWLDYSDRIYFLFLPKTFDDFIEQLSFFSFYTIKHLPKKGLEELVRERLATVFRRHLAGHIYYNPICGHAAICDDSRPMDAWKN
jgi:hypothetical protein